MPKPRKPANQKPLKTLKIFCEGEKTEPNYLKGYIATLDSEARKSVVEVEPTRKNTAVQLVDEAIKAKKSADSLPEDEFWVVYDRESIAKYSDELHSRAISKASGADVKVALCNVCFEYWILLHFIDTDAPYQNFDDLKKNSALNQEVKKVCGCDYDKSSASLFDSIKKLIPDAKRRGARLNKRGVENAESGRSKPYQINPYVGIVDLLDAIDKFT
ncbi:RloB family protein [Sphingomonas yunnanensis]|uniref:RloB family protein n=1 Tax=Sphingomonas yunnanensis TaxID=310400 RepID=UPI001CA78866|nr:RloB family protein [Sphingomonas yunnanensis]MBY9062637.1 RloB family protein [Sphingomonas yunnanensis]